MLSELVYWGGAIVLGLVLSYIVFSRFIPSMYDMGFFDKENERTTHTGLIPRLGGVVFLPLTLFLCTLLWWIRGAIVPIDGIEPIHSEILLLVPSMIVLYVTGIRDDLMGVSYLPKFLAQIVSSVMLVLSGLHITRLEGLFGVTNMPTIIGLFISSFFVIWVINAMNLIDGIDGLSGALAFLALSFYSILLLTSGMYIYALVCLVMLCCLCIFLIYNIRGNVEKKQKIFMGDTGSLTMGLLLSFIALRLLTPQSHLGYDALPLMWIFAPLIIPCFDLVHVFLARVLSGKHPFQADKGHIHHRLLALGLSKIQVLALLLISAVVFLLINVFGAVLIDINLLILFDLLLWGGLNWFVSYRRNKILSKLS